MNQRPSIILPATLHEHAKYISFENGHFINKVYSDIIGLDHISHFAIYIVNNETDIMSILTYSPSILYNLISQNICRYFGTLSPTFYKYLDIYTWGETYHSKAANKIRNLVEKRNGLHQGVVLVKRMKSHTILYSFGSRKSDIRLIDYINNNIDKFYSMGDHCFDLVKPIYLRYNDEDFVQNTTKTKSHQHNESRLIDIDSYRRRKLTVK